MKWANDGREKIHRHANSFGNLLVEGFHYIGLFAIGATTAWASVIAFVSMLQRGSVGVDDILLLFIYLELGAMVGIYFKTNHLPIRFLLYIALTAMTRYLIGDVAHHPAPSIGLVYLSGGIFLLALSVVAVRYASYKFPSVRGAAALDAEVEGQDQGQGRR